MAIGLVVQGPKPLPKSNRYLSFALPPAVNLEFEAFTVMSCPETRVGFSSGSQTGPEVSGEKKIDFTAFCTIAFDPVLTPGISMNSKSSEAELTPAAVGRPIVSFSVPVARPQSVAAGALRVSS